MILPPIAMKRFILLFFCLSAICTPPAHASSKNKGAVGPLPLPKSKSQGRSKVVENLKKRTANIKKEASQCKVGSVADGMESTATTLLDTPSIYSIEVTGKAECMGMPHMDDWQYGLVYDMNIGKRYNPLLLYRIDNGTNNKRGVVIKSGLAKKIVRDNLLSDDSDCRAAAQRIVDEGNFSSALAPDGLRLYFVEKRNINAHQSGVA